VRERLAWAAKGFVCMGGTCMGGACMGSQPAERSSHKTEGVGQGHEQLKRGGGAERQV
jgi:hypothetical protein